MTITNRCPGFDYFDAGEEGGRIDFGIAWAKGGRIQSALAAAGEFGGWRFERSVVGEAVAPLRAVLDMSVSIFPLRIDSGRIHWLYNWSVCQHLIPREDKEGQQAESERDSLRSIGWRVASPGRACYWDLLRWATQNIPRKPNRQHRSMRAMRIKRRRARYAVTG
jgi:hypothetical protein